MSADVANDARNEESAGITLPNDAYLLIATSGLAHTRMATLDISRIGVKNIEGKPSGHRLQPTFR